MPAGRVPSRKSREAKAPSSRAKPRRSGRSGRPPRKDGGAGSRRLSGEAPGASGGNRPSKAIHKLTDLEQMKVLADPLRIRILELLCEERTTKQVAAILGEPPTRLYHHVAALERVGLIRLSRTRQSRGALEKYYVAVARAFSADPRLFSFGRAAEVAEATQVIAAQVLEQTSADLRTLLESGESPAVLEEEGILSYMEVRAAPKAIKAVRTRLLKILAKLAEDAKKGDTTSSKAKPRSSRTPYRLTIAFFPLAGRKSSG